MVVWIIGLSGSGKTTVGEKLVDIMKVSGRTPVFIDGDSIREIFANDNDKVDYSVRGRLINAVRITAMCKWLDSQGFDVVCCILSIFPELRHDHRSIFSSYFEVYLKCGLDELIKRDNKGVYSKALAGLDNNVVGVGIDFPEPHDPDVVFDTDSKELSVDEIVIDIFSMIVAFDKNYEV